MAYHTDSIQSLLTEIAGINQEFVNKKNIEGLNFNIFEVLNISHREVKLHSAFIAELLNPEGSHDKGVLFLNLFIELINTKLSKGEVSIDFRVSQFVKVKKEYIIGPKTGTTGGHIDILLTDQSNKHLIVENKIFAADQENQTLRYHNFDKNAPILYLTLNGSSPTFFSTARSEEVMQKIINLSYKEDIIGWLKCCMENSGTHSALIETLKQYISTIKNLTNQSMKYEEVNEIVEMVLQDKNMAVALQTISEANLWWAVKCRIFKDLIPEILGPDGIVKKMDLKITFNQSQENFGKRGFDFWYHRDSWRYCIYFYFESDFSDLSCGIDIKDDNDKRELDEKQKFLDHLNEGDISKDKWILMQSFDSFNDTPILDLPEHGVRIFSEKLHYYMATLKELL